MRSYGHPICAALIVLAFAATRAAAHTGGAPELTAPLTVFTPAGIMAGGDVPPHAAAPAVDRWLEGPPAPGRAAGTGATFNVGGGVPPLAQPPNPNGLLGGLPPGGAGSTPPWGHVGEIIGGEISGGEVGGSTPVRPLPIPGAAMLGLIGLVAVDAYRRRRA
ncbi:MAG: hypothetical protein AB1601_15690 [Planctomycetota bacterium]